MKLSIITVNLNNCDGLQKTIDSVICQTFRDFEWIVIDGGSTDGSRELIEQYSERFAYWVSEPDKGIYNAMNKGIKEAKGEYVLFLNSGDWLVDFDTLERVWQHGSSDADFVYGLFSGEGLKNIPSKLDLYYFLYSTLPHQSTFIRRELLASNPYSENYRLVSDWKFFLEQIVFHEASYMAVDVDVYRLQQGGASSDNVAMMEERRRALEELFHPMELELLDKYLAYETDGMKSYYDYIGQHPYVAKSVRRMVRMHKMFHHG